MKRIAAPFFAAAVTFVVTACTSPDLLSLLDVDAGASADSRQPRPDAAVSTGGGGSSGDSGMSGSGGAHGCKLDSDCDRNAPYCDVRSGTCFQCLTDQNCPTKLCALDTHTCKRCVLDSDCPAATPLCDRDDGRCIQCRSDASCATGEVCAAQAHACTTRCRATADCVGAGRPICAVSAGVCVECASDQDCGGKPPFCDLDTGTCVECLKNSDCASGFCTPYEPRCVQCLTNSDCGTGRLCREFACFG